jgi:Ca2+-binding EF-hand superfamily protein
MMKRAFVVSANVMSASLMIGSVGIFLAGAGSMALAQDQYPDSAKLLLRYDANKDGKVTREEMEAGLKADFAAADTNHDGVLDPSEIRAENDRRLARDGLSAAPVRDWNLDGSADMDEFSNAVHSYFDALDKNKDGELSSSELGGSAYPAQKAPKARPDSIMAPSNDPSKESGNNF